MSQFEHKFEKLLSEPAFNRLKRSFSNYSIFTFSHLKEDHTTNLIGWLLNPREAHGSSIFFDFFLNAVSKSLSTSDIENKDYLSKQVEYLKNNIDMQNRYIFETEHNMGGKSRCDVVGVSLDGHISIFIENKISSTLSGNQLDVYRKYADKHFANKTPLLILMDATPERDLLKTAKNKNYSKRWLKIDYDWLGEAIQDYLSGPVPLEVSIILKSFQTELEPYVSTALNQSNIYWTEAWKDIESLGKDYYDLWESKSYKKIRLLTAFQITQRDQKLPKYADFVYQYPEIFEAMEEYGFFNTLEYTEDLNIGFSYEIDIHRKNVYFFTGTLPSVGKYWPVNLKVSQHISKTDNKSKSPREVYSFSLGYAPNTVRNDYSELVKTYFGERETDIIRTNSKNSELEKSEVKERLIECLKKLHAETLLFETTPEYQKLLKSV